ncbi:hypothetical protein LTS12_026501 [Elasticomyces elasticus]|nr:hypothetical protein LTS12_026501 [Elasticomyces elasticus]
MYRTKVDGSVVGTPCEYGIKGYGSPKGFVKRSSLADYRSGSWKAKRTDGRRLKFSAWLSGLRAALLKSPLIIGTDLTKATKRTLDIFGNKDLVKINQDPNVGQSISPFRWGINPDFVSNASHPAEYWSGNSSYGVIFMILNTQDSPQSMFFNLTESWAIRAGRQYSVYDMWEHKHTGVAVRNMTLHLPAHGVAALLLNDDGPEPSSFNGSCAMYYQCSFPNGTYISN